MAEIGLLEGFEENTTCKTCLVNPCLEVGMLLGNLTTLQMHFPKLDRCFAAFKTGNGYVWQFDNSIMMVNYCVACQLVTLLGNYIHWSCEMSNLHIPNH